MRQNSCQSWLRDLYTCRWHLFRTGMRSRFKPARPSFAAPALSGLSCRSERLRLFGAPESMGVMRRKATRMVFVLLLAQPWALSQQALPISSHCPLTLEGFGEKSDDVNVRPPAHFHIRFLRPKVAAYTGTLYGPSAVLDGEQVSKAIHSQASPGASIAAATWWIRPLVEVSHFDITSMTFEDGSEWHASKDRQCIFTPLPARVIE